MLGDSEVQTATRCGVIKTGWQLKKETLFRRGKQQLGWGRGAGKPSGYGEGGTDMVDGEEKGLCVVPVADLDATPPHKPKGGKERGPGGKKNNHLGE